MPRFNERSLQWMDILGRFEAHSHQEHTHNTLGLIGSLKDQGRTFWPSNSSQLRRWEEGCTELWSFINELGTRRDVNGQDLSTAMREFIQEFEHTTWRMYQMVYGAVEDPEDNQEIANMFDWFNLVFRSAICALLSGWITDKQDNLVIATHINLTTGETTQEWSRTTMKVPEEYQRAVKRL